MLVDIKEVRDGLRIRGANHPHTGVYINRNDVYDIVMNKTPWKSFDYGVCDDYTQVLEKYRDKIKSDKEYVIVLQVIHKQGQYSLNGWKWSKQGPYIGKQKQEAEYLFDEPMITEVYEYSIFEVGGHENEK